MTSAPTDTPVRTAPWPRWPQWDDTDLDQVRAAVDSGVWWGVGAAPVVTFEDAWSHFLGVRHTKACSNGTVSLQIALRALGVGSGAEVIVPPYTFAATATAVLEVAALPVFADIDPETYCLDPDAVEAAITSRTQAVIVVHLAGHAADMDRLGALCRKHGVALIEDAAHAHGSEWDGQRVGGFGEFGSWSFQGSKNLPSGEGGALTTNDERLAQLADSYRNCGRVPEGEWYEHHLLGENYRLTPMQAALLDAGLARLPAQIEQREATASWLDRELATIEGIRPLRRDERATVHAHHLYQFRYDSAAFAGLSRADFAGALRAEGIPASPGYPVPLYRQPLFTERRFDVRATGWHEGVQATRYERLHLPVCERACAETVWLPHELLLAPVAEMADVVTAVAKIQARERR